MGDVFEERFKEVLDRIMRSLDRVSKDVDELLERGDVYRAYRVWRDSVLDSMRELRSVLDSISEEVKTSSLNEEELRRFTELVRNGVRDVVDKLEEVGEKLRKVRGRGYVAVWMGCGPFKHVIREVVGSVDVTIDRVLDSVGELVERIERTFEEVGKRATQVISVRIKEQDVEIIDKLVDAGIFKSRSEAVAYFTRKGIEASRDWIEKALEQAKKIKELQESLRRELEKA